MKYKNTVRIKRTVSFAAAVAMAVSAVPIMPAYAETGTKSYVYDKYKVDYTVNSEWFGKQNVSVTLTNTSDEPILNWALGYDAQGDIDGIWNGYVSNQNGEDYIIKNMGYNYEIAPYQSITYGYVLSTSDYVEPDFFNLCSKRVDKASGYDVKLNVTGDWGEGFQGEIVLTNTSDVPIEAWELSFDTNFSINNLWGGKILNAENNSYTLASEMWTNPIAPGTSVTIGFVGSKDASVKPVLSGTSVSEVVIDGTTSAGEEEEIPDISITANAVYSEENANIVLSWNTNVEKGSFDVLYSTDNVEYNSAGTVKNAHSYVMPANDLTGTVYFKVIQTVKDRIGESAIVSVDIPVPVVKETPDITLSAEYNAETGYIDVLWSSTVADGTFDILTSYNDCEYESAAVVSETSSYSFAPENAGEYSIKTVQTTSAGVTGESNAAKVTVPETEAKEPDVDPEIDWEDETDTDNDGLPDVYENNYFGTDPENPDSDSDGLPDGYEVINLGTDPLKADSDDNGVNDSDEDFDKDGLNNLREYELGTDPASDDTDYDGLSDGDEVNNYNTDPLKFDNDEDGVSDGDEVKLGLDPNSVSTDGVLDSERTFVQHIGENSKIFSRINNADNPYKVSIDIECAGVAENNLYSRESCYSNAMSNPAIVGIIPEFDYCSSLKVKDVVVNFNLNSNIIQNTNGEFMDTSNEFVGIRRFNVFRYFEDNNLLLPVETFFDENENRVYTHTDRLGTYCLIDMEIWLDNFGIEPKKSTFETASRFSATENSGDSINTLTKLMTTNSINSTDEYIDIAIAVYQSGYTDLVKKELRITCEDLFRRAASNGKKVRIYFVSPFGSSIGGVTYVSNMNEANKAINCVPNIIHEIMESSEAKELRYSLEYIDRSLIPIMSENRYVFIVDVGCGPIVNTADKYASDIKIKTNDFYVIYDKYNFNKVDYMALAGEKTYEMYVSNGRYNFADHIINVIFGEELFGNMIITSCGLTPMPDDFGEISESSLQDYDDDGLLDKDEIFFESELISSRQELPTFQECIDYTSKTQKLTYVENGLARFMHININNTLFTEYVKKYVHVVPLISDPTNEDGDDDGLLDGKRIENAGVIVAPVDNKPLRYNGDKNVWKLHIELLLTGQYSTKYSQAAYMPVIDEYLASYGLILGATGVVKPFRNKFMTPIGERFLDFLWDDKNQALHSKPFPQWQIIGGYSNLYDRIFDLATVGNMRRDKLEMSDSQNNKYILWFWRGDYINLGSGAEIGVYLNAWDNENDFSIVSITLPMTLELYYCDYYGARNIYNWHPTEEQWWITGFSPDYMNPNVNDLFMIASVDLSKDVRMYETLKDKYSKDNDHDYLIFDDEYHTVWFEWNSFYNIGL